MPYAESMNSRLRDIAVYVSEPEKGCYLQLSSKQVDGGVREISRSSAGRHLYFGFGTADRGHRAPVLVFHLVLLLLASMAPMVRPAANAR